MDVHIKTEPELLEDGIFSSLEFIAENPHEYSALTVTETNIDSNHILKQDASKSQRKKYNRPRISGDIVNDSQPDEFTIYLKSRFLKTFQEKGCSPETVAKYAKAYNVKLEEVNEYFDRAAKEAQRYVYQECDSLSFSNITEWLKYLEKTGASKQCNYEPAIVMNAIVNNEYHPSPETMNGIDLRKIYKFLSNALMGLPQKQLDEASAKFLSDEFQNLIQEANTDKGDKDVKHMKRKIEHSLKAKTKRKPNNLDPLNTDIKELEEKL